MPVHASFVWIVNQKNYSSLWGYPVFTTDGKSVCYLPLSIQDTATPLAPIQVWSADLQQFFDLFPPNRILNDAFFQKVPDPIVWQSLNEQGFIRRNIITTSHKRVNFKDFYPEESLPNGDNQQVNHTTINHISVTDVAERVSIMDRVSNSRSRALVFWRFLTEWLIKEDSQGLVIKETQCSCGAIHKYYQAEWLMPVRNNRWIRYEDLHPVVDASSLTEMLRDNEWKLDALKENPETVKLLEAIGVTEFDFMRAFVAKDDEERNAQDQIFRDILAETGGDLNQIGYLRQILETSGGDVSEVTEIVQDLKEDEELSGYLEARRKYRNDLHENQRLGSEVEDLVKEVLENEGFSVERTGTGSDFEISEETVDLITLDINKEDTSWLVEVKATRTEGDNQSVRMTSTQAQTAVKEKEKFLLCVVPLGQKKVTPETVSKNMWFIQNIGGRLTPLCENLDLLEDFREEITTKASLGVKLVCEAGTTRIQVNRSVWEDEGFPLKNLAENLN